MEDNLSVRSKFDLVLGSKAEGRLLNMKDVGHVVKFENANYYIIKLWMWTKEIYYLVHNRDSETRYTIYAKKIDDETCPRFQNPVGCAWVPDDLRTHLEVKFNIPSVRVFMSLFPSTC